MSAATLPEGSRVSELALTVSDLEESGVAYSKEEGATRFRDPAGHTIIASTATERVLEGE